MAPDWMTRREEALVKSVEPQAGLNWKVLMVLVDSRGWMGLSKMLDSMRSEKCEARCSRSGRYLKQCWMRPE